MKWYKHFSDALDDPFIQELIDEFGPSGYLAWFGLLEIISKENGNKLTGKLDVKPQYLKRKLRISVNKLKQIYEFCSKEVEENLNKTSTKPKLMFNFQKEKWNFYCPKLLELKDNYTKDLQVTCKEPPNQIEEEVEEEVKEEEEKEINKKSILLEKLKEEIIQIEQYLQVFPEPELEKDAIEVIKHLRVTKNPNSTLKPEKYEINILIKNWLVSDEYPKEILMKLINGAGSKDFEKKLLQVNYILKPEHRAKLLQLEESITSTKNPNRIETENEKQWNFPSDHGKIAL